MLRHAICALAALQFGTTPAAADTILTFDIPGFLNFESVDPRYGDRVSNTSDAIGGYGTDGTGFTPNVVVDYGTTGEEPSLWNSGYGSLTNVLFNDADGASTFTTLFTADSGYLVELVSFDIASFLGRPRTIAGVQALDALTNDPLWSVGTTLVSGSGPLSLMPGVSAAQIALVIELSGLGTFSDDIGLDNIRFTQALAPGPAPVPEPATVSLVGVALLAVARRRFRRRCKPVQAQRSSTSL